MRCATINARVRAHTAAQSPYCDQQPAPCSRWGRGAAEPRELAGNATAQTTPPPLVGGCAVAASYVWAGDRRPRRRWARALLGAAARASQPAGVHAHHAKRQHELTPIPGGQAAPARVVRATNPRTTSRMPNANGHTSYVAAVARARMYGACARTHAHHSAATTRWTQLRGEAPVGRATQPTVAPPPCDAAPRSMGPSA